MGEHIRIREANERANASLEAVKEMAPHVNNHSMMLNALSQAVYEMVNRISAMEIVVSRYLDQQGVNANQLLMDHIAEQHQKEQDAANESTDDEPTTIPTETAE